jgi:hypothetical protein
LIHQSPYIPGDVQSGHPDAAVSHQIRHAGRAGEDRRSGFITEQRPAFWPSLQPPFATRSNPRNEMSVGQRVFWIAAIALGAAVSAVLDLGGHVSRRAREPRQASQGLAETKSLRIPATMSARCLSRGKEQSHA